MLVLPLPARLYFSTSHVQLLLRGEDAGAQPLAGICVQCWVSRGLGMKETREKREEEGRRKQWKSQRQKRKGGEEKSER